MAGQRKLLNIKHMQIQEKFFMEKGAVFYNIRSAKLSGPDELGNGKGCLVLVGCRLFCSCLS